MAHRGTSGSIIKVPFNGLTISDGKVVIGFGKGHFIPMQSAGTFGHESRQKIRKCTCIGAPART
jgi:hypothetical protein